MIEMEVICSCFDLALGLLFFVVVVLFVVVIFACAQQNFTLHFTDMCLVVGLQMPMRLFNGCLSLLNQSQY